MIPDKYNDLPKHLKLIFEWGDPREKNNSYREWEYYLPHGFSDADVPALLQVLGDKELHQSEDINQAFVPLYAWRILGQLRSTEAIDSLLALAIESEDDDWAGSEVPVALAMIGQPAIPLAAGILSGVAEEEYAKQIAADTLTEMVKQHPELREEVIDHFRTYLQSPDPDYQIHNGLLASHLIDIKAVELIDEIRALYEKDYAEISVAGDLEDVEIALGLREERSTPRPHYVIPGAEGLREMLDLFASGGFPGSDTPAQPRRVAVPHAPETYVRETVKVGRNDPCPCGSGKKYKRCCMNL